MLSPGLDAARIKLKLNSQADEQDGKLLLSASKLENRRYLYRHWQAFVMTEAGIGK